MKDLQAAEDIYPAPGRGAIQARVASEAWSPSFFPSGPLVPRSNCWRAATRKVRWPGPSPSVRRGIHHIAFAVDDIRAEMDRLRTEGFTPAERAQARRRQQARVLRTPKSANGVLVELCQENRRSRRAPGRPPSSLRVPAYQDQAPPMRLGDDKDKRHRAHRQLTGTWRPVQMGVASSQASWEAAKEAHVERAVGRIRQDAHRRDRAMPFFRTHVQTRIPGVGHDDHRVAERLSSFQEAVIIAGVDAEMEAAEGPGRRRPTDRGRGRITRCARERGPGDRRCIG